MKRIVSILMVLITLVALVSMAGCGTTYRYRGASVRPAIDGTHNGETPRARGNADTHNRARHHVGRHHNVDEYRANADGTIVPGRTRDGMRSNSIVGNPSITTNAPAPNAPSVPDVKRPNAPQTEDAKRSNTPAPTVPTPKVEKPVKPAS